MFFYIGKRGFDGGAGRASMDQQHQLVERAGDLAEMGGRACTYPPHEQRAAFTKNTSQAQASGGRSASRGSRTSHGSDVPRPAAIASPRGPSN